MNHSMDDPQQQEIKKRRQFAFRLNLFFFSTFFIFSVLIVRLAILQFVEGEELKQSEKLINTKSDPIPPIRGNILDSTGHRIAYSTPTQSLYYRLPNGIKDDEALEFAKKLSEIFAKYGEKGKPVMKPEEILKQMDINATMSYGYVPRRIKTGLTEEEIAYFMERRDEFPELDIVEEALRNYDTDTIAVQLVGYLKKYNSASLVLNKYKDIERQTSQTSENKYLPFEDVGFDGIELMYQDELRGKNGSRTFPVNAQNKIIGAPTIVEPEKGDNLYLTINRDVQLKTEQAIVEHLKKIRTSTIKSEAAPNAKAGFAVAMEVQTGKVVAMASMPDYDPNVWRGGRISSEDLAAVSPFMLNGAIRDVPANYKDNKERGKHPSSLVPLGSTMKPLTVLMGLNEGLISTSTTYTDTGVFAFGAKGHEVKIRNASNHVYGKLDPAKAIQVSSNPYMSMIGNALYLRNGKEGIGILDSYLKQFGLGVKTGSRLPNESPGLVEYNHEYKKSGSAQSPLIYASFGQQGKYTALQLAQYASTLATRGKRPKPQFVEKIEDSSGKLVQGYTTEILNEVDIPTKYWDVVQKGMEQVRVQGFDGFPYRFARKTGTSQSDVAGKLIDNAVFIAYAPADKPKLAVAVVVPEGEFGSWGAAPIARKIFDAYDEAIGLTDSGPRKPPLQDQAANGSSDGATNGTADQQQTATQ